MGILLDVADRKSDVGGGGPERKRGPWKYNLKNVILSIC